MSNSFLAKWLAMALVRCQAASRPGRTRMRPWFCSRLYAMASTSLATVAENVIVCDHIQHLHQRVWAVARSLSGKGNEMTPRQERKSLRSCTHIRCVLGEIGGVFPGHGRHTGPTVIIKTVRAELASGARQCHTNTVAECSTV